MSRAVLLELFEDVEHGCSRSHPERRTRESIARAFARLRESLEREGIGGLELIVREAELRALHRAGERRWLHDVELVDGQYVCLWCRLDDSYAGIARDLIARLGPSRVSPAVLRAAGVEELSDAG